MKMPLKSFSRRRSRAFTLVELLVSIAILSILMLVLASITFQTEAVWKNTSAKIDQFRGARIGFDTLAARLSQATLNTYIGYSDGTSNHTFYNTASFSPTTFVRLSELRFLCGSSAITMQNIPTPYSERPHPTHSVFFIAPLGYNGTSAALTQLLNVCGYYVEFGGDETLPAFFQNAQESAGFQPRYRYRLMELFQQSENNSVYTNTTKVGNNSQVVGSADWNGWVANAFSNPEKSAPLHILAENIIALVLLPQLGQDQKKSGGNDSFNSYDLAPYYGYDSTQLGAAGSPSSGDPTGGTGQSSGSADAGTLDSKNQLPPLIQVTMVAIDEASAVRIQNQFGKDAPDFGLNNLFQDAKNYSQDLNQLKANLQQSVFTDDLGTYNPTVNLPKNINYHIFTSMVSIKGAQWSSLQTN